MKLMNMGRISAGLLLYFVTVAWSSVAGAAIIVTPGVDNTGTDNVVSNACSGTSTGPGLTVQGCLNSDHGYFVNFTSDENLLISGGQASLVAQDGAFSFLTVSLDSGDTFSKLLLNIDANAAGFVTFTGSPGGVSTPFALSASGQNKFIITGEDFLWVSFTTTVGVMSVDLASDVKQVRIGGISTGGGDPVPEPTTLAIFGLGLLGAGLTRRRTRK